MAWPQIFCFMLFISKLIISVDQCSFMEIAILYCADSDSVHISKLLFMKLTENCLSNWCVIAWVCMVIYVLRCCRCGMFRACVCVTVISAGISYRIQQWITECDQRLASESKWHPRDGSQVKRPSYSLSLSQQCVSLIRGYSTIHCDTHWTSLMGCVESPQNNSTKVFGSRCLCPSCANC